MKIKQFDLKYNLLIDILSWFCRLRGECCFVCTKVFRATHSCSAMGISEKKQGRRMYDIEREWERENAGIVSMCNTIKLW